MDYFRYYHKIFPYLKTTVLIAVSGDTVFRYFTTVGTGSELFTGMPAGNKMVFNCVDIIKFPGDKMVEHRCFMDTNDANRMMQIMSEKIKETGNKTTKTK